MGKQRRATLSYSRRQFLQAAGVTGLAGLGGCSGTTASGQSTTIAILGPGSLQNALTNGLAPTLDVPVQVEVHGSATVARMIDEGQRDPDVVAVADPALFDSILNPSWHAVFASNSLVLVYNPDTAGGRRLASAGSETWYEPVLEGTVSLGRTDPDQDPLGYRTRFMFELASRYYDDVSGLGTQVLQADQLYPETGLLSQFETGAIDAAVAYRNMAVERDYEYITFPDQINLSNPQYETDWYATTAYTLPSGETIRGGLITYGATIRHMSDAAVSVFDPLTTGQYLTDHGFLRREQFPTYTGEVPLAVKQATAASGQATGTTGTANLDSGRESASPITELTVLL